ncbi:protein tiptop-like [Macrobrachium rosenbergii]|uniref:protein tiptop-like n=1 Tax=Macrobrachium rosenbergii TaxID=79674 RepID=UPI0034D7A32A
MSIKVRRISGDSDWYSVLMQGNAILEKLQLVLREEGEQKEPGVEGEGGDSPSSSPRHRRDSGSITSRDGMSPKMSPRHSPRESLNSSPAHLTSPRATPPALRPLASSPPFMRGSDNETDILDFSLRKSPAPTREDLLSISSRSSLAGSPPPGLQRPGDSPLDLSVPRKRAADALLEAAQGKMHHELAKGLGAWGIPLPPHLASAIGLRPDLAALKPDLGLWNGKLRESTATKLPPFPMGIPTPTEASRALERMSELSKLGGDGGLDLFRGGLTGNSGRATAWQSHWLNKGQDATKDVLKCVWCKASFNTLAELTTHMKEAKHCGVNLPPPVPPPSSSASSIHTHLPPQYTPTKTPVSKPPSSSSSIASGSSSSSDLMSSIKETMPLPRKLVRGQDVWLGKGAEQTRQILKCMWCGQSFKSLAEMTQHMQQTQHYTNIISQEQIISWKSPEEKTNNQSHVNAVLTCKVCDQAFASLKELSNHMVKNAHYKEHIMRSITESGAKRRQTREKRKKSLPVRKLLELERAQQELRSSDSFRSGKDQGGSGRITCEKCGDKIDTSLFVDHIRNCVGTSSRELLKTALLSPDSDYSKIDSAPETDSEGKKTPEKTPRDSPREKDFDKPKSGRGASESPSVLNALEKLIEKSFDSGKGKPGAGPLGSSILRRLGIDESADYSKPLMDPQLMGMYATFSRLHGGPPLGVGAPSTFNLPPSFGSGDRGAGLRGVGDAMMSPSADSDTRDTFPRSPSRPGSRPASTGSITRDGSGSERSLELLRPDSHHAATPDDFATPTENGEDHSDNERESICGREEVKQELPEINGEMSDHESVSAKEEVRVKEEIRVKEEFKLKEEGEEDNNEMNNETGQESPSGRLLDSPAGCSSRSGTPHSEASVGRSGSALGAAGLGGLSALLGGGGEGSSSHPLAALQKLCDKTETQPRPPPVSGASTGPQTNPGAILAFSWACNDAVTADSIMKCAFCDTPFISKGAYRHHLSKMHFVKDGVIPENANAKASNGKPPPSNSKATTPPAPPVEESPHSKFLKYTELAKQLSSK